LTSFCPDLRAGAFLFGVFFLNLNLALYPNLNPKASLFRPSRLPMEQLRLRLGLGLRIKLGAAGIEMQPLIRRKVFQRISRPAGLIGGRRDT
jgi:hypothetical protein